MKSHSTVDGKQGTALEIFGGLSSSYESALDLATLIQDRYWKRWVVENAGLEAGDRVLDIGCGTCLLEDRLANAGCKVVGLDLTERMIRVGQSKSLPSVEGLLVGDAEALPFPDRAFDSVVSCYVLKYVDLEKLAHEVARVLKLDGRVVMYDFVRPRGLFSPFLRMYLHGVMSVASYFLRLVGSDAAPTFRALPRIVEGARWIDTVERVLTNEGISDLVVKNLSGGIVGAFSGRKVRGEQPLDTGPRVSSGTEIEMGNP